MQIDGACMVGAPTAVYCGWTVLYCTVLCFAPPIRKSAFKAKAQVSRPLQKAVHNELSAISFSVGSPRVPWYGVSGPKFNRGSGEPALVRVVRISTLENGVSTVLDTSQEEFRRFWWVRRRQTMIPTITTVRRTTMPTTTDMYRLKLVVLAVESDSSAVVFTVNTPTLVGAAVSEPHAPWNCSASTVTPPAMQLPVGLSQPHGPRQWNAQRAERHTSIGLVLSV
jgi:hypothetical protein